MPTNDWQIGVQWDKKWNNVNWSQPDGPFTKVYPQQVSANSNLEIWEPFTELTGCFIFGCGHSVNMVYLQLDYDYDTGMQVGLILCPTCSYLSRVISPWIDAYNPITAAILTP